MPGSVPATETVMATRLTALLRAGDPIAGRVALSRWDFARCGLAGMLIGILGPR